MRNMLRFMTVASLVLGVAVAQAQEKPASFVIRAGVLFPSDGDARDIQKTGFTVGGSYLLYRKGVSGMTSKPSIDLQYTSLSGGGDRFNSISALYAERMTLGKPGSFGTFYGGLGIGGAWTDARVAGSKDNKFGFAGEVILGLQHTSPFSLEAYYRLGSSVKGVSPNGLGIRLGYAF